MQTQERLTESVVAVLEKGLLPRGVLVALQAEHTCMTLRGVRKESSQMLTMASSGRYAEDAAARGRLESARALLNAGADPVAVNDWGHNASDWAQWAKDPAEIRALFADRESQT